MGISKKADKRLAQMFWPFGSQKGFSLAEVMVAAGILGGLSLVVLNMTTDISKSQRTMESKFQISQLQSRIDELLRSKVGCFETVGDGGYTRDATATGIQIDPIQTVREGAAPGDKEKILFIGQVFEASGGSPPLSVTDIRLLSYIDADGNVTDTPEETIDVSDGAGGVTTVEYGDAIVRVTFVKTNIGGPAGAANSGQNMYGELTVVRDFRIKIRVNPGTNEIDQCYAVEENVTEAACDALSGIYSPVDGRCREIKIQEDPSDIASVYAITSRASMLIDGGGLDIGDVGTFPEPGPVPPVGGLRVENDADIRGNADIAGNMLVQGTGAFEGNVGIGVPNADANVRLLVQDDPGLGGDTGIRVRGGADQVDILTGNAEALNVGASGSRVGVKINTDTGDMIQGQNDGTTYFRVSAEGQVFIDPYGATGTTSLDIGSGGGSYFPAYIRNQPANISNNGDWDLDRSRGDEIATKRWAAGVIYAEINDTDIENILATITTYAENNQMDAIKNMVCSSSRSRAILGEGTAAETEGDYVSSSYNASGVCEHEVEHCSAGKRCGELYVTGIDATGEIFSDTMVRVTGGGGIVELENNGTIYATSTIESLQEVTAPVIRATGTTPAGGNSGICGDVGCSTKFGYQPCNAGYMMVGLAYGHVICAN